MTDFFNDENTGLDSTSVDSNDPFADALSKSGVDSKPKRVLPKGFGKKLLIIFSSVLVLGGIGTVGYKVWENNQQQALIRQEQENLAIKRSDAYNSFFTQLRGFNTTSLMLVADGLSSYLDQEKAYADGNTARLGFLDTVLASVSKTDTGYRTVNWDYVNVVMQNIDFEKIREMYNASGIQEGTYDYQDKMIDLFSTYISTNLNKMLEKSAEYSVDYSHLLPNPYNSYELTYEDVTDNIDGKIIVKEQFATDLDKALFSSNEFHNVLDIFALIATGKIGEYKDNPNFAKWQKDVEHFSVLLANVEGDLANENYVNSINNLHGVNIGTNESSLENVKNALSSNLEAYKVLYPLPKYIEYTDTARGYQKQSLLHYGWVGAYYLQNEHKDISGISTRVSAQIGDGTYDSPAAFGTSIITKAKGIDGKYYDIRITLKDLKVGADAIQRALELDERNQGFTTASELTLGVVTFTVENIGTENIEILSEMTLTDRTLNAIPRSGTMFGFRDKMLVESGQTVEMDDWFFARNVEGSNLIWGKSFNRQFDAIWFNVLGNIVYDANGYRQERPETVTEVNKAQEDLNKLLDGADDTSSVPEEIVAE